MKGIIRDRAALTSLQPMEVASYLRMAGWSQVDLQSGRVSVWSKPAGSGEFYEALVPLDRGLRDFDLRMSDLLTVLEASEGRSQFDIYRDLQTSSADLIRVRYLARESADGTVGLNQGVDLIAHSRDLLLASACVTAQPRVWYRRRRPPEAEAYLRSVRLGQTEVGSYVVTMLSQVAPDLRGTKAPPGSPIPKDPFERRVTTMLARNLSDTRVAAEQAMLTGELDAFRQSARTGITVNLCDAISGMAPEQQGHDGIRFEFSWSTMRPQRIVVQSSILLTPDAIKVIGEAGRELREESPFEEVDLRGTVRQLARTEDEQIGVATVFGAIEGRPLNVRVFLNNEDYHKAIIAHEARQRVHCNGDVSREGKSFVMRDPAGFRIIEKA